MLFESDPGSPAVLNSTNTVPFVQPSAAIGLQHEHSALSISCAVPCQGGVSFNSLILRVLIVNLHCLALYI